MISFLRGTVVSIEKESIIIDVSGFGIEIFPTKSLFEQAQIGEELKCPTYMQISDAGIFMFGFASEIERAFFLELIQIKTIGGKMANKLMRTLDLSALISAIEQDNANALSVPGFGAAKASRVCFEMKPKIAKKFAGLAESLIGQSGLSVCAVDSFVADALTGLGFSRGEATRAIAAAHAVSDETEWNEENLLKASLSILQRK